MCGIAGIMSFNSVLQEEHLKKMTDKIVHRGPDGEGFWLNHDKNVGFGHRRLSIIDLSSQGKQPMLYDEGQYSITFNGEIYNYLELKASLENEGFLFKTKTDTEVLLALYSQKKENCLKYLDGMFSFAIWDEKEKKLFCARDRFGEKPFFYRHKKNESFVFGSEMKALWANGVSRNPNYRRVYYYLAYDVVDDPYDSSSTFYEEIIQLPASHYLTLNASGELKINQYWTLKNIDINPDIRVEYAIEKFYSLFQDSVNKRLRSDVEVGSSLSGGIDSSAIVMMIDQIKKPNQIQKTFSARFKNYVKDEGKHIKEVLNSCKNVQPHNTWPSGQNLLNNLDKLFYHQEEPFGSSSIYAQFEVMKLAKENNVTVLLDGQGADEILAGYTKYYLYYYGHLLRNNKHKYNSEVSNYSKLYENWKFSNSEKLNLYFPKFAVSLERMNKKLSTKSVRRLKYLNSDFINNFKHLKNPFEKFDSLRDSLIGSLFSRGLPELLRYCDRNSMAFSREVRLPFLSHELVEFIFSLPDDFIIRDGWTKFILRKSMQDTLPKSITWRKDKIGYEPPQKRWLENSKIKDRIDHSKEILKKENIIDSMDHCDGWKSLMLENVLK